MVPQVRAFHLALEKLLSTGEIEEDGGAIMRALNTVREDLIDLQEHNLALGHARAEEDPASLLRVVAAGTTNAHTSS